MTLKFSGHSHFKLFFAVRYFRENTVLLFPSTHTTGYEAGEWVESTVFQVISPASFFKECTELCVAKFGSGAVVTWGAWLLAVYGSHDHHSLIPRSQVKLCTWRTSFFLQGWAIHLWSFLCFQSGNLLPVLESFTRQQSTNRPWILYSMRSSNCEQSRDNQSFFGLVLN